MSGDFTCQLISWFSNVKRDLPWRSTLDPYKIWLSEVILQQTRVDQGLPYYLAFTERFPTIQDLASASEQDVLKLWEGLGYYSRARNLHSTARLIAENYDGIFPTSYTELIKLRGIGPYTAAAISSIAFGEARPVVDGNVFRFISRYFGITQDIMKPASRGVFESVLADLIDPVQPGTFNQAVMEYGATVCSPSPKCQVCTFTSGCYAYKNKLQDNLPVKAKKKPVTEIFMDYLVLEHQGEFLLKRRTETIWKGLFEFLLIEKSEPESMETIRFLQNHSLEIAHRSLTYKHLLSHRKLWVTFYHVQLPDRELFKKLAVSHGLTSFSEEDVVNLPRPKIIVNYLQEAVN